MKEKEREKEKEELTKSNGNKIIEDNVKTIDQEIEIPLVVSQNTNLNTTTINSDSILKSNSPTKVVENTPIKSNINVKTKPVPKLNFT